MPNEQQEEDKQPEVDASATPVITDWKQLIPPTGVLGIAAFALSYFCQFAYYAAFGISPEIAGVDEVTAALRMTPLAFFALFFGAMILLLLWGVANWIDKQIKDFSLLSGLPNGILLPGLLIALSLLALFVSSQEPNSPDSLRTFGVSGLWIGGLFLGLGFLRLMIESRYGKILANLAISLLVFLPSSIYLALLVEQGAQEIIKTGQTRSLAPFLVGAQPQYVCISSLDTKQRILPKSVTASPVLLVSINQNFTVVYPRSVSQTYVFPSDGILASIVNSPSSPCSGK